MKNKKIEYALSKVFTTGISFAILFSIFNFFDHHLRGNSIIKDLIANFCTSVIVFFIVGYFEYDSYIKKLEAQKKELSQEEFKCFKCKAIIKASESKCPQCGWTWVG